MVIAQDELKKIVSAKCANICDYLGMHKCEGGVVARCYLPDAKECALVSLRTRESVVMQKLDDSGFFEIFLKGKRNPFNYYYKVKVNIKY